MKHKLVVIVDAATLAHDAVCTKLLVLMQNEREILAEIYEVFLTLVLSLRKKT